MNKKLIWISIWQVFLIILFGISLLRIVIILSAQDLNRLPENVTPPEFAKSFRYSHGQIRFNRNGTLEDEHLEFSISVVTFFVSYLAFIIVMLKYKNHHVLPAAMGPLKRPFDDDSYLRPSKHEATLEEIKKLAEKMD